MRKFINAKRWISAASIAGLMLSGAPGHLAKAQEVQGAEKSYVVLAVDATAAKEVAAEFDGEKMDSNKKLVEADLTKQEIRKLQKDEDIICVEDNIILTASAEEIESSAAEEIEIPNLETKQWNREAVGITEDNAVEGAETKSSVKIEILDSGVAASTDLDAERYIDLTRDIADGEFNLMFADDNGHGTAMAAVIAAAGNTKHRELQYPAAYEEVIAVGSADEAGKLSENTSLGTELELLAPGENVVSEDVLSAVRVISGTSIATAQVSAVASLLMQRHPGKGGDFIRALLKSSARKVKSEESCPAGFVDYQYAEEIYDVFADTYTKTDMAEIESHNDAPVADYSKEAEEMVEGLWDKDDEHANLLGVANNFGISANQFAIIKQAAPWADDINKRYKNAANNPSSQLHGTANYVAHAQYLWYLAYYLGSSSTGPSPSDKPALNNKISKAKAKAKAKMPSAILNTNDFQNLYNGTGELLKYDLHYVGKKVPTSRKLQLFALGYLSHLLSDTYSHRTIVPPAVKYISGNAHDNKNLLGKDFRCIDLNIKDGSCEFRWLVQSANDKEVVNKHYIDNPKFYPNRHTNAQHCIAKELKRALKDKEETYTYQLFIQKPGYEKNSKLSGLKRFAKDCGGNISAVSADDWKKYST